MYGLKPVPFKNRDFIVISLGRFRGHLLRPQGFHWVYGCGAVRGEIAGG
jgi:hypothetical protein